MLRSIAVLTAAFATACAGTTPATTPAPAPAPVPATPPVTTQTPPTTPPTALPPVPTAFDPVGTYELQITFGGNPLAVTMELWKESGTWRGYVGNSNLGSADLTAMSVDGRWFKGTFAAANGGPTFVFEMEIAANNTATGSWTGNGDGSKIAGKKTK